VTSPQAAAPSGRRKRPAWQRVLIVAAVIAVVAVLPAVVAGWLAGGHAALAVVLGEGGALLGATRGGVAPMARMVPVLGVVTALAALAGFGWGWVALMAVVGVAAGVGYPHGYAPALLASAMPAVFMLEGLTAWRAVVVGVFALLAAIIGVLLARHLGVPATLPAPATGNRLEWFYGAMGMVALGGGAAIAVGSGIPHGYWIVLTLIIVGAALAAGDTHRNRQRLAGNLGGLAITIPISFVPLPAWAFYALAFVLLVVAFSFITRRYWLYALLESAAVVLLVSAGQAGTTILETGEARAAATLIGCALVALLVAGVRLALPHLPRVSAPGAVDA